MKIEKSFSEGKFRDVLLCSSVSLDGGNSCSWMGSLVVGCCKASSSWALHLLTSY